MLYGIDALHEPGMHLALAALVISDQVGLDILDPVGNVV